VLVCGPWMHNDGAALSAGRAVSYVCASASTTCTLTLPPGDHVCVAAS
jgi:hypothetical protein